MGGKLAFVGCNFDHSTKIGSRITGKASFSKWFSGQLVPITTNEQ